MQPSREHTIKARGRTLPAAACTIVLLIALSGTASAQYLDPGTGSYLFQLLIAGGTAVLYAAYRNKERLSRFFARFVRRKT